MPEQQDERVGIVYIDNPSTYEVRRTFVEWLSENEPSPEYDEAYPTPPPPMRSVPNRAGRARCYVCGRPDYRAKMTRCSNAYLCDEHAHLYVECGGCGGFRHREERECVRCVGNWVPDHHYVPRLIPHEIPWERKHPDRDRLMLGVELEVETHGKLKVAKAVMQGGFPFVFVKHDGSLNYGIEVVSHPMTERWYRKHVSEWDRLLAVLAAEDAFDHTSCGLHVHMSKRAFTSLHLYKFMRLVYENPDRVRRFTGRTRGALDRYATLRETKQNVLQKAKYKDNIEPEHRYVAVNLDNPETVELRIFRGTVDPLAFHAAIEFSLAAYHYTKDEALRKVTWDRFKKWTEKQGKPYLNLLRGLS